LVDRAIEIVADRGINAKIDQTRWNSICREMQSAFDAGNYEQGTIDSIAAITALLQRHFPARGANPDELPDRPMQL
jgi:uncharacterized membrane protein